MSHATPADDRLIAPDRLAALDLLRFLAAAAVMIYHFTYRLVVEGGSVQLSPLAAITRHGYLGVDVFFIISGFVVLWSATGRTATRFGRARILRLYPEFWVAVLVAAAIFALVPDGVPARTPREVALNLTMLPQYLGAPYVDGVYWTLGVEMKFYFLLWVIILVGQLERVEYLLYGWLALLLAANTVDVGGAVRAVIIHPYGSFFAAGGLFFLVYSKGWSPARAGGLVVALALSAHQAVAGMDLFISPAHITQAAQVATILVIVGAFGLFAMVRHADWSPGARRTTALAGALTYPLYLLHYSAKELFLTSSSWGTPLLRVLIAIAFSLALSWAVLKVAERWVKPSLKLILDRVLSFLPSRSEAPSSR